MKKLLLILLAVSFCLSSCNYIQEKKEEEARKARQAYIADSTAKAQERIRQSVEKARKYREEQEHNSAVKNSIIVSSIYFNPPLVQYHHLNKGRCDIKLKFKNISGKTIKNITFNFRFSDGEYDNLRCDSTRSRIATVKVEGPLKNGKEVTLNRKGVFYNSCAQHLNYENLIIEYMDDTTVDISGTEVFLHLYKEDYEKVKNTYPKI